MRAAAKGEGISAYMNLYKWFTGTAGMAVSERIKKLMSPAPPKQESEIADAIDKWTETRRNFASIKDEYKLQEPFLFTALESIMNVGKAKDFYESQRFKSNEFFNFKEQKV